MSEHYITTMDYQLSTTISTIHVNIEFHMPYRDFTRELNVEYR